MYVVSFYHCPSFWEVLSNMLHLALLFEWWFIFAVSNRGFSFVVLGFLFLLCIVTPLSQVMGGPEPLNMINPTTFFTFSSQFRTLSSFFVVGSYLDLSYLFVVNRFC